MHSDSTRVMRATSGALVLLTSVGLLAAMTASPSLAQSVDDSGPAAPVLEPDPDTTVVPQGDDSVDGVGVLVTEVPAPQDAASLRATAKRGSRSGDKIVRVKPELSPGPSEKYGVAQVVTMKFPVSIDRKKQVERAITIEGFRNGKKDKPVALPVGRWGWTDSRTAVYRPKEFWPGNATIKFTVSLKGVVVANEDGTTYQGGPHSDLVHKMRTGRKLVLEIKNSSHQLKVRKNGRVVKRFGVSLGKAKWETRSGIKVLSNTKYRKLRMTGTDRYTGETWDVISPYSMPLTTNGEYIHGAPWARHRIGSANGSHGCTNMNSEDARWLFNRVRAGDPVVTKGTSRSMHEGLAYTQGKPWTYSWKNWKKKSQFFG